MANEIIESYKILEEKIKSENAKIFFEMLDSNYPAFKSRAIQELTKLKIETPAIKEFIEDPDREVRLSSLKYLEKLALLEEEDLIKLTKDISPAIRRESIKFFISMGIEDEKIIEEKIKDPDPTVRYQLLISYLEYYPEESPKLIEKMKDDPYVKIKQLIEALENVSETMLDDTIPSNIKKISLIRYYEKTDAMVFFTTLKEVYGEVDKETKKIILRFLAGLPCDIIKKYLEGKIEEEKDYEILMSITKVIRKVCGTEDIPSWLINNFVDHKDPKIVKFGLKLAQDKEDMGYVDYARELLDEVDDDLVIGAADYLTFFQDYQLTDYVSEFLHSVSSKRIKEALKIIKKLKLENFINEISDIANNKKYPMSIRKNAINLLKYFKAKNLWEIPFNILKDPYENGQLKLASLNALLKLNPEMVTNI
jgi:HEAT repeat protein